MKAKNKKGEKRDCFVVKRVTGEMGCFRWGVSVLVSVLVSAPIPAENRDL